MGRPRQLPDDWTLLQLRDVEGLTQAEIAERYNVSGAAVSRRFINMKAGAMMNYRDVIPWQIEDRHHSLYAAQRLKAHIKERQGGELSQTARRRLGDWLARLERDGVVLDYRPVDVGGPWVYVARSKADNALVIRWPADMQPPTEEQRKLLKMATAR